MAQYKVPQDVEADDKLIGPFSFRQFVYLLVAAGLIAVAVGLFQLFPLLAILPVIPALLFIVLALPLKKDQPMETYLAALVSYYLKPRTRLWTPGQRESTIKITAPKIVEDVRTRDISGEEATHRLSFLADIVDSEGYAIKGVNNSVMRDDLAAEANTANDMFDSYHSEVIDQAINKGESQRHEDMIRNMREAIDRSENMSMAGMPLVNNRVTLTSQTPSVEVPQRIEPAPMANALNATAKPEPIVEKPVENFSDVVVQPMQNVPQKPAKPSIIELANNSDFSVATIAKEANRINRKDEGEVFISLH